MTHFSDSSLWHLIQQTERHFHLGSDSHWFTALHAGFEAPLADGIDGRLVQAQAQGAHDFYVSGNSFRIDNDGENYASRACSEYLGSTLEISDGALTSPPMR